MKLRVLFVAVIILVSTVAVEAATVTYTIVARDSIAVSGTPVAGMHMDVSLSSLKGQYDRLTQEEYVLFSYEGSAVLEISRLTLEVHSNKSSGAGTLAAIVDDELVWTISGNFNNVSWNGEYSTEYVPISKSFMPALKLNNQSLYVQVKSSENSLYVRSLTIEYEKLSTACNTVSFYTGGVSQIEPIAEESVGAGIVLPQLDWHNDNWHFIGWSAEPVENSTERPNYYQAGQTFYPQEDMTMYALYSEPEIQLEWVQDTVFETGEYLINYPFYGVEADGEVNSGQIDVVKIELKQQSSSGLYKYPTNSWNDKAVYMLDFLTDSTLSIKHVMTRSFVGYPIDEPKTPKLTTDSMVWKYRVYDNKQVIIYHDYGKTRYFFTPVAGQDLSNSDEYAYKLSKMSSKVNANALFNTAHCPKPLPTAITSYPLGSSINGELFCPVVITPIGIENANKLLLTLYTLQGIQIKSCYDNMSFEGLSSGYYLLQVERTTYKICIW